MTVFRGSWKLEPGPSPGTALVRLHQELSLAFMPPYPIDRYILHISTSVCRNVLTDLQAEAERQGALGKVAAVTSGAGAPLTEAEAAPEKAAAPAVAGAGAARAEPGGGADRSGGGAVQPAAMQGTPPPPPLAGETLSRFVWEAEAAPFSAHAQGLLDKDKARRGRRSAFSAFVCLLGIAFASVVVKKVAARIRRRRQ